MLNKALSQASVILAGTAAQARFIAYCMEEDLSRMQGRGYQEPPLRGVLDEYRTAWSEAMNTALGISADELQAARTSANESARQAGGRPRA